MVKFSVKNKIYPYWCKLKGLHKTEPPYVHKSHVVNQIGDIREISKLMKYNRRRSFNNENNQSYNKYLSRLIKKRKYVYHDLGITPEIDDFLKFTKKMYRVRKNLEWFC